MDQITKGVRELIRVVMRERGIKHRSDLYQVHTVCYADQGRSSVEYEGPVYLSYTDDGVVFAFAFHANEPLRIDRVSVRWAHLSVDNQVQHWRANAKFTVDVARIDIHRPDFSDVLGSFLDKHIRDRNKRPAKWMRRFKDTDQEYVFVPDSGHRQETKRFSLADKFLCWFIRKLYKIDLNDLDFHWRHATRRHFRCSDEELEQITRTVNALSKVEKAEVEANTEKILNNEWTEF